MKNSTVVFLTIADYDNLGVGYIASLLSESGFKTRIVDSRAAKPVLLKNLKELDPLIIGFSVIFLNYIEHFTILIDYLRKGGINCHFTAGGHYASLKYEELFRMAPQLDSIIRFEGEYPMLELAKCISNGNDWKRIEGLTYIENNRIIANPVWPPEMDLDKFPYPIRSPFKNYAFQKKFTTILASRGCTHNCSFCNTRVFYRQASFPLKRIRKPEMVVSEMYYLYNKKKCSVFLFHDDDFPIRSIIQPDWIVRFCNELERTGLNKKIIWKINCRPDDVEKESFSLMKKNGLYLVFLGLEDGTDTGLTRLNKQLTVANNVKGISILKKLRIGFDYGFMLFQPSTTFSSLIENLDFLRLVCGDGYTPVTFLKLIPLYETRIEKELLKSGRLNQTGIIGDYTFREEPLNRYYKFITDCFTEWLRYPKGLENMSKWARNWLAVYSQYFGDTQKELKYYKKIKRVISESNLFLIDIMIELSVVFKSDLDISDKHSLEGYREQINSNHNYFKNEIISTMAELVSFVEDHK